MYKDTNGCIDMRLNELKNLIIKENKKFITKDGDEIDIDRLYYSDSYAYEIATEEFGYNFDFNERFWKSPMPLYHATIEENLESIKENGLKASNITRGINNRSVDNTIFFTMEPTEIEGLSQSYGNVILEVNTKKNERRWRYPLRKS